MNLSIKRTILWCIFPFVFLACEKEENENENNLPLAVTVLTESNGDIFQIDVLGSSSLVETNLTNELGIGDFNVSNVQGTLITYFNKVSDGVQVWQKDVLTGEESVLEDFCFNQENEFTDEVSNSQNKVIKVNIAVGSDNSADINIYIYDQLSNSCSNVSIGTGAFVTRPIVVGEAIYVYWNNEQQQNVISKVNLQNGVIEGELIVEGNFQVFASESELYVRLTRDHIVQIYDANSFVRLASYQAEIWPTSQTGLIESTIVGSSWVTSITHAQPSPILFSPVIFDLSTGQYVKGNDFFLADVKQKVEAQLQRGIGSFTSYAIDLPADIVVVGYEGGLIFTNFDSDLLNIVELNHTPQHIIIR